MLRFLADENFNNDIARGLQLRNPRVDLIRIQETEIVRAKDPVVLAWAAHNGRIVLTHDKATMPAFAYARLAAGEAMPGVFIVNDRISVRHAIDDLLLLDECTDPFEWDGKVLYLPL